MFSYEPQPNYVGTVYLFHLQLLMIAMCLISQAVKFHRLFNYFQLFNLFQHFQCFKLNLILKSFKISIISLHLNKSELHSMFIIIFHSTNTSVYIFMFYFLFCIYLFHNKGSIKIFNRHIFFSFDFLNSEKIFVNLKFKFLSGPLLF